MKRVYTVTVITSLLVVALFWGVFLISRDPGSGDKVIKVGFVYDGDESTTFTANFMKAQYAMEYKLGDQVEVLVKSNVPDGEGERSIRELAEAGCDLIFTNSSAFSDETKMLAAEYPAIQFCQATGSNANTEPVLSNYHTFMASIYQGRYLTGIAAGLKLREMIDSGVIRPEEAVVGYIAAFPQAEVISGFTAFFLGIRSVAPEAVMKVRYTDTWSDYKLEKSSAEKLIAEGCVIISQHSDTTGPAVVCESEYPDRIVYHVGYNQSMINIAPTTSLISSRINWEPYITAACEAVLQGKSIEKNVKGRVYGNDTGAGIEEDWVQILELNSLIAAPGTAEELKKTEAMMKQGDCHVFYGDYRGTDPNDPSDVVDLNEEYPETEKQSAPTFHYILDDVITVEE